MLPFFQAPETIRIYLEVPTRMHFLVFPPPGKVIEIRQINVEYVKNGKITEHWRISEELKMMQQLGLVP